MSYFANKTAVVTGAASGIGKELSRALLKRGTRVVLTDIDRDTLDSTEKELSQLGETEAHLLDVTDADAVDSVVGEVAQRHGRLDFMFNNAGIAIFGNAKDMTREDWQRLVDINIRGVIHGVSAAYPIMIEQGSGHILNTASAAGLAPTPGGTGYSMTKHAVVGLSTSLRAEANLYGVRVSAICPGFIDTPIVQNAKMINIDRDQAMREFKLKFHSPVALAERVMAGAERNQPIIVFTTFARVGWLLYRMMPFAANRLLPSTLRDNPLFPQR